MKSFETLWFDSGLIGLIVGYYEESLKGLIVWLGEPVISQDSQVSNPVESRSQRANCC